VGCYDFWIYCGPLNKMNFVSFEVKLKELLLTSKILTISTSSTSNPIILLFL
jgi:hypothetical protein